MKRRLWKILAILVILVALLAAGLQWYASSRFTPDKLVAEIERGRNCRAEIAGSSVSLFSFPARVEITGLRILPADSQSLDGRLLAQRKPAKESETYLSVPRAVLEMNVWSLLTRHIAVKDFLMENAEAKMIRTKKGENTLATLLGPRLVKGPDGKKVPARPKAAEAPETEETPSTPFTSSLDSARITGATITVRNDKKKQTLVFQDVSISLAGLTLIPGDHSARADLKVNLRLIMDDLETSRRQLDFPIQIDGHQIAFDPATGAFADGATVDLTLRKDAYIDRIPTLEKLAQKLGKLKDQIGLNLTALPVNGTLRQDTVIQTSIKDSVLGFAGDANFYFDTYRIKVKQGSWLSLEDQSHEFDGIFTANDQITADAVSGVESFLKAKDEKLAVIARKTIIDEVLLNDKQQMALPFLSTEDIGRPEVKLTNAFEKKLGKAVTVFAKDLLLDAATGGDGLMNLIDGLINKDDKKSEDKKDKP